VSDAAEIVGHRQMDLAVELDFADHVPKPELGHDAADGWPSTRPVTNAWAARRSAKLGCLSKSILSINGT
jgi:hypothetical protein